MLDFIVVALVLAAVFLLLREFNCWYWKINEGLATLKEIRDIMKNQKL